MTMARTSMQSLLRENIRQALGVVRGHPLRSGLLILGVTIAIMTILAMVTVMSGLVGKIKSDLESSSRPYIFVTRFDFFVSGDDDEQDISRRKKFKPADAIALERECPLLDRVCYFINEENPYILYFKERHTAPLELDGASHTFPNLFSFAIENGRYYTEREVMQRERVVCLGYGPAKDLFPNENPIGKEISIRDKRYKVIGTFANRNHFIGAISNNFAVIPYTSYHKDFETDADDPTIAANVLDGSALDEAQEQITHVLRMQRGVKPGEENDFHTFTSTAFLEIVGQVTLAISAVLIVIASIGLLVGGIGVMNIMLISVAERTREIGVRMAVGAHKRDIMQQFLMESAVLTGIGGVLGTGFGFVAAYLVARWIHFPFEFSIPWTIGSILFSALIGIVFGLYPARRAASLHPVEALRCE